MDHQENNMIKAKILKEFWEAIEKFSDKLEAKIDKEEGFRYPNGIVPEEIKHQLMEDAMDKIIDYLIGKT